MHKRMHTHMDPQKQMTPPSPHHLHGLQLSADFLQFPVHCLVLGCELGSLFLKLCFATHLLSVLELHTGKKREEGEEREGRVKVNGGGR